MSDHPGATILVVDDEPRNCRLLEALLHAENYTTRTATSGKEALSLIRKTPPDLILLDIMMPEMNGFEVVRHIKADPATKNIPVIMVTALDDRNSKLTALQNGAEEFLGKPVDRAELQVRVRNLLRLKEYQDFLTLHNQILEKLVENRTQQLASSYRDTVFTLTRATEYKDKDTGQHIQRICAYCREVATHMQLGKIFSDAIFYASAMHDIGKIGIPDHILLKPGPLTPEEWKIMRNHTVLGAQILAESDSPYLQMGMEIALNHHERWDGSGYPNGLKGEAIPLAARIMNLCDQYDALRSKRPYKPPLSHEEVVTIITQGDGRTRPGHFDPDVMQAFSELTETFRNIYETYENRIS